ncbi:uncharacterized protein [Physcomitrium patens]|uniref:uncharacterized protein isoform X1 n=1 Tax=Physcomitrium patens TaxID=3218 RepID=UPI000D176210|nr:uncharacterized protein LOC112294315 isoform X1 [Physcomitrium patens]|eukprot:XP_024400379.1 uncharacterized protein LOC112294315 isoform X1 [Physcomitrella patens]
MSWFDHESSLLGSDSWGRHGGWVCGLEVCEARAVSPSHLFVSPQVRTWTQEFRSGLSVSTSFCGDRLRERFGSSEFTCSPHVCGCRRGSAFCRMVSKKTVIRLPYFRTRSNSCDNIEFLVKLTHQHVIVTGLNE